MNPALSLLNELVNQHERMAVLADQLNWDALSVAWGTTEPSFLALRELHLSALSIPEGQEARQLIEQLLALQMRISERVKPWQEQVRPMLDSFSQHPLKSM